MVSAGSPPTPERRPTRCVAGVTLGLALAGQACSWSEQRPAEDQAGPDAIAVLTAPSASSALLAVAATAPVELDAGAPVEVSDSVLLQIGDVEGTTASRAGALLGPMTEPVGKCTPPEPGVLNVRLRSEGRRTAVEVTAGSSVDPATRRCIVEALATLDLSQAIPDDTASSSQPQRFASTVSISW
jgi:hypothetical protein